MAKSRKIRVMFSSRCLDPFPSAGGRRLSELRMELKRDIERIKVGGRKIFEVWINEDAPPAPGTEDSWETCLNAVRECDVVIVLANGNAGWGKSGSDIGICHAEYTVAMASGRGRVRVVMLPFIDVRAGAEAELDERFRRDLAKLTPFRGGVVQSEADLKARVVEAIADAVVVQAQLGATVAVSGRFDVGAALEWSRMNFSQRKRAMETVLRACLAGQQGSQPISQAYSFPLAGQNVLMVPHAVPAAFTVSAAREMVGRPFLDDYQWAADMDDVVGPVHVIACHRGATEQQATALLGFPDATVVSGPFGIYVADRVQMIQFALLANCRDESLTRHAFQRFLEWLSQSKEDVNVVSRAQSRARIIKTIAEEYREAK